VLGGGGGWDADLEGGGGGPLAPPPPPRGGGGGIPLDLCCSAFDGAFGLLAPLSNCGEDDGLGSPPGGGGRVLACWAGSDTLELSLLGGGGGKFRSGGGGGKSTFAGGGGKPPLLGGGGGRSPFPVEIAEEPPREGGGGGPLEDVLGFGFSLFETDEVRSGGGGFALAFTILVFCGGICTFGPGGPLPFCTGLGTFGFGPLAPGGSRAGPPAPPGGLLSPAGFNFGIPPANNPPSPPGAPPMEDEDEDEAPPLSLLLGPFEACFAFPTNGELLSLVTVFFNLAPL